MGAKVPSRGRQGNTLGGFQSRKRLEGHWRNEAELQKSLAAFHPLGCAMTGSGSAVAAAFGSKAEAENCLRGLAHLREKGTRLFFVTPVPYGVLRI